MDRRAFIENSLAIPLMPSMKYRTFVSDEEMVIEKAQEGKPHKGKVLAAVQPHCDDIPLFAGGTVAKLIAEGYTGYLIRTSNDDHAGKGATVGEVVRNNEIDNEGVAQVLGLSKTYDLGYRNHRMDNMSIIELRARLIYLIRMSKIDTVISYDPWGHYEENPDHYVTARAVEAACWMAGGKWDYPEHMDAGLAPHAVSEKYYFARGPQLVNRIVDISTHIEEKIDANRVNITQGPAGDAGSILLEKLRAEGKTLSILGDNAEAANRNYIQHFVMDHDSEFLRGIQSDRILGEKYGLGWAEGFHYVGPRKSKLPQYIDEHGK
ncbi:MAG: PIG-L family deacetylase [Saprospiraceae bacterium]|nr:PIG-L family deacetylase [Saprospiraceae bacterium]